MFGMFKNPAKHRSFDYQPIYYDKRKEELQERIEMLTGVSKEQQSDHRSPEAIKARISASFRDNRRQSAPPTQVGRQSWVIFFIVLCVLMAVVYFMLKYLSDA